MSRGEPNKTIQSLHGLIREAYELILPSLKDQNISATLRLDAINDCVLADAVQIKQLLVNLMRNGKHAMAGAAKREMIVSTSSTEKDLIQVDLLDTGCGVDERLRSQLFEPVPSTKKGGMGVGLSISRTIVEAHYGKIWFQPNPEGGAIFSFTLPLADQENDQ